MNVVPESLLVHRAVRCSIALAFAVGVVQLSACHEPSNASSGVLSAREEAPDPGPSFPTSVSGLNYTTYYIPRFSITDADGNVGGGPNIGPADGSGKPAGGGAESCCVIVPEKWQKDMTVTVRWSSEKVADGKTPGTWYSAVAKVPPYGSPHYNFWVQFLEGDRIRVRVDDDNPLNMPLADDAYITQGVLDEKANKEMHQ
jgi:hypothetical protein